MKPLSAGDARIWEGISEATSAEDVDDQPALVADVGFGANVGAVMSVLFSMKTISLVTIYAGSLLIGIGYALVAVAVPLICLEAFGPKDSELYVQRHGAGHGRRLAAVQRLLRHERLLQHDLPAARRHLRADDSNPDRYRVKGKGRQKLTVMMRIFASAGTFAENPRSGAAFAPFRLVVALRRKYTCAQR